MQLATTILFLGFPLAFNAEVAEGADGADAEKANDEAPTAELNEAPEETPKAEARLQAGPWDHGKSWEGVGLIMIMISIP